jgi:hypothetical protein
VRKLTLSEWAQLGELIASITVVISLLLVVYSLERNTAAQYGSTENLLFESHTNIASQFITDPTLAAIRIKVRHGEPLSEVEAVRWDVYKALLLDVWSMAYSRHSEDLLADRHWQSWDTYFTDHFRNSDLRITQEWWDGNRSGFDPGFWEHVRVAVFED